VTLPRLTRPVLILSAVMTVIAAFACPAEATLGPFEVMSTDSTTSLRFGFAGQLRMLYESRDLGNDYVYRDIFMESRRVRLILSGTIADRDLSYRLHLSTNPGSLELMDFYFNYRYRPHLQLRFGQFKVPFTRYRIQSFSRLTLVDWAIVTSAFGAERQMGFALHNGYERPPKWGYVLGWFTGVNARASHGTGVADAYGVDVENPSDLSESDGRVDFHPEFFAHLSHSSGEIDLLSDTDRERTDLRWSVAVSGAWDTDPYWHEDFQLRAASEFLMKYRGLSFSTVGYAGWVELPEWTEANFEESTELGMVGWLAQAAYRLCCGYEFSARYAIVDLKDGLINDARGYLPFPGINTQMMREEEFRLGLNVYLHEDNLKIQNDAGWIKKTRRDDTRTDFQVRSQFQLTF
jgi:hypothetical protein